MHADFRDFILNRVHNIVELKEYVNLNNTVMKGD